MTLSIWRALCIGVLAFLLVGCGTPAAEVPMQRQTIDDLTIALAAPPQPVVNQQAVFVVTLTNAAGNPIDGADVYLDLTMAEMKMGTNTPIAEAQGNGRYRAQSALDMAGDWTFTVHATVNNKDYAATFASTVAEQQGGTQNEGSHENMDH
jgi:hypothetical protein